MAKSSVGNIETVYIHPVSVDTILELIDAMNIDSCTCEPCGNWKAIRGKIIASRDFSYDVGTEGVV